MVIVAAFGESVKQLRLTRGGDPRRQNDVDTIEPKVGTSKVIVLAAELQESISSVGRTEADVATVLHQRPVFGCVDAGLQQFRILLELMSKHVAFNTVANLIDYEKVDRALT